MRYAPAFAFLPLALAATACGSDESNSKNSLPPSTVSTTSSSTGSSGSSAGTSGSSGPTTSATGISIGDFSTSAGGAGSGETCVTETATAALEPVYLVFGFDRSGSMGKGDEDWHDQSLKWDPVATATRAFLEDPASVGISAALKFFPDSSEEDERCDASRYSNPEVPMTALPSDDFADVIDAVPDEDWIGGTPTLAVLTGLVSYIGDQRTANPGRYAIVLVTDGYPQDCPDSSIESVAELAASVSDTIPTYVIGVANPPFDDAPDNVTNLAEIAQAGGTEQAFVIDTGDPTQTSRDFASAIERIRGAAISCEMTIPAAPAGRTFDKEAVQVSYGAEGTDRTELRYDPECGENAWFYDDPENPSRIVLCPDACSVVQAAATVTLAVDFACEPLFDIPK
jgi:hypothetical protein